MMWKTKNWHVDMISAVLLITQFHLTNSFRFSGSSVNNNVVNNVGEITLQWRYVNDNGEDSFQIKCGYIDEATNDTVYFINKEGKNRPTITNQTTRLGSRIKIPANKDYEQMVGFEIINPTQCDPRKFKCDATVLDNGGNKTKVSSNIHVLSNGDCEVSINSGNAVIPTLFISIFLVLLSIMSFN